MENPPSDPRIEQSFLEEAAVVIPCYNAGERLRRVVETALETLPRVTVVDDGSTDGCVAAIEGLPVRIVSLPRNRGKGAAILEGFRSVFEDARTTCAVIVDADGQHDPREAPKLYRAFAGSGADLVIGARRFDGPKVPWASWVGNRLTSSVTRVLFPGVRDALVEGGGHGIPDTQSGFRLHSRRFAEAVLATIPEGRYETEMAIVLKAVREGYAIRSVPIATRYEVGNPTTHFRKIRDSLRVYRTLLEARWTGPIGR